MLLNALGFDVFPACSDLCRGPVLEKYEPDDLEKGMNHV
jgi:hypothetical protein